MNERERNQGEYNPRINSWKEEIMRRKRKEKRAYFHTR